MNNIYLIVLILVGFLRAAQANPLISFKSCYQLRNYLVSNAVKRVGPWGLGNPMYGRSFARRRGGTPKALTFTSAPTGNSVSPPVEGVDFSGTNVQVSGVDEPDIVKTDGRRIFVISRNKFYFISVMKNGATGKVIANLTLPFYPRDMLFYGNSVMLISEQYENIKSSPTQVSSSSSSSRRIAFPFPSFRKRPITMLYRIDVTNGKAKIKNSTKIYGRYISARSVNGIARIVMSYDPSNTLPFVYPNANLTQQEATEENKKIIKRSRLSNWVPILQSNGTICVNSRWCYKYNNRRYLSSCRSIYYPKNDFSGFSFLSVATVRIYGPLQTKATSIVADGSTVYSTAKSLYVATTKYQWDFGPTDFIIRSSKFETSFHKFALGQSSSNYIGSGSVSGSVLNQFSMHEYDDTFFVATTDGAPWWGARNTSVSKVSSFRVFSNSLKKVGEVGGLGKGERIYAVRYIKDVAYVVTFRQVDPLYIVDLSNVYKLRVLGELKIPGYSAYLHPIAPGRILGVGQEATAEGRTTGAKVTLFDVSNVGKPTELSSWTLKGSYTNAEWDHRAFLYWAPEKLAVLPVSVYTKDFKQRFVGSIALEVSEKSIKERGRYSHSCCGNRWELGIKRNFVIGKVHLWSLSNNALQVNDIKTLKKENVIKLHEPVNFE